MNSQIGFKNVGTADRIVRLVLAAALLYFAAQSTGAVAIALLVAAGVLVLTSLVRFCPIYRVFGIRTCRT
jgi:ACR3 family arsenite efflux pump ArsB